MAVTLDQVPLRDRGLGPAAILMSESQERMMAITEPASLPRFLEICAKWDVPATVVGEVTGTGSLDITWQGAKVAEMPPETAAEGPLYDRQAQRPASQDKLRLDAPLIAAPRTGDQLRTDLLALIGSPAAAAKNWVTEQYDHYVRGNTVLAMPHDAGVLRVDEESFLGISIATDGNGRYCLLDPYAGTQLALAEAYRNVAATGAVPLAVTNCLNFGSPEDPAVMWQFAESVRGLADACQVLGVPVTGGNVSFYNQTGTLAIQPTPVVGVLGVLSDVRRRLPSGFPAQGETIMLLGTTRPEFGGSLWAFFCQGHLGGLPPEVDLPAEERLAAVLATAAEAELLSGAHDLSDGGLAVALAESCLTGGTGCSVRLPEDAFTTLFSESAARAIVSVRTGAETRFADLCTEHAVPASVLGRTGGDALKVAGQFTIPVEELRVIHQATLPALFD
jgi:phosphoribosylformylglycinamidine synthase subunit PurL